MHLVLMRPGSEVMLISFLGRFMRGRGGKSVPSSVSLVLINQVNEVSVIRMVFLSRGASGFSSDDRLFQFSSL